MYKNKKYVLILIMLSYFFLMFGNSIISLTNPDEVFYTLTAKEMVEHKSWMTPYLFNQPQFEKPILLYWLLRIAFIIFGENSFSARFFPALFGMLGVLAVYFLGLVAFKHPKKAFISSLVLCSSGLYLGLARTVFTDMIFCVFILFSLAAFFWGYAQTSKKDLSIILCFIFSALAVLTKGPLGFFLPALVVLVFLLIRKEIKYLFCKSSLWGLLIFILLSFSWYVLMVKKYGTSFTDEFFYNDHIRRIFEAEHSTNDTWYFYPFSAIGCMFPWSIFLLVALFYLFRNLRHGQPIYLFLASWIVVTFLIFQPAHSKLISYILPMFPALSLVSGDFIYNIALGENKRRLLKTLFLLTWLILAVMPIAMVVCLFRFPGYLSSTLPVYLMITLFITWLCLILRFLRKGIFLKIIYLLSLFVLVFLAIIPLIKDDIEPYISSRDICTYMMQNYPVGDTILASKVFLRGVRYYTGKDVVLFNPFAKNFFSPHPILFLDTDEKARDFLDRHGTTYCVLRKNSLEDIDRIAKAYGFQVALLKVVGNAYLVRVNPK